MAYNPAFFGKTANAPSRSTATGYQNGTLSSIAMARPVSTDSTGKLAPINVSDSLSVQRFVGITSAAIPSAANGTIYNAGRAEALGAELSSFNFGDALYIDKTGVLTSTKPDYGINGFATGDYVIFIGVVVKNEFNPGEKDIQLMIEVIGQL